MIKVSLLEHTFVGATCLAPACMHARSCMNMCMCQRLTSLLSKPSMNMFMNMCMCQRLPSMDMHEHMHCHAEASTGQCQRLPDPGDGGGQEARLCAPHVVCMQPCIAVASRCAHAWCNMVHASTCMVLDCVIVSSCSCTHNASCIHRVFT